MRTIGKAALALGLAALVWAPTANACGGTFCDSPPPGQPPMPVQQSGENIVFVLAEGHVEAHVQIQYTGDPTRFAWLVPVPAVPEVSVGSQQLLTNLLNATVPTFQLRYSVDLCGGGNVSSGGCGFTPGGASNDSSKASNNVGSDAAVHADDSNIVVSHEAVGAFDVTILRPNTADDIASWLDDNGFLRADGAPPILKDYIDRGHVFLAVKLKPSAGVNEIHPLVIRYEGNEPCIPLKLTSIAANEDMGVRAFFLGDRRVVPTSYRHVTLNPARLDWTGFGANYTAAVSRAVDAEGADGHAFVTEYAGTSSVVATTGVFTTSWSADIFRFIEPTRVVGLLESQGLVSCGVACTSSHPLVMPMVRKYLPAPVGVGETDFYSCLSCYKDQIDPNAWNAANFAAELEERVVGPGRHAADILAHNPYLTRLYTTISPYEMTEDPTFAPASLAAPPVTSQFSATTHITCGGDTAVEISGRPPIALSGLSMPTFTGDMPDALTVEEYDTEGKATLLYDNASVIDRDIEASNQAKGYPHAAPKINGRGRGGCVMGSGAAGPGGAFAAALVLSFFRRRRKQAPANVPTDDGSHRPRR